MEKLYIKQLKKTDPVRSASLEKIVAARLSQRYQGSLEDKNTSQYAIMSFQNNNTRTEETNNSSSTPSDPFSISVTTIHGFHNFTQPYRIGSLSMHDAERFISDRRANMTRFMMHGEMSEKSTLKYYGPGSEKEKEEEIAKAAAAAHVAMASSGGIYGPTPKGGLVKARLFNKLMNPSLGKTFLVGDDTMGNDGDDDDVMADVAFRETKGVGRTTKARKELLSTFGGDGSLNIDDDGVIGGSNDAEFGGRRQIFNRYVNTDRDRDQGGDGDDGGNADDDTMINSMGKGLDESRVFASTSEGLAMDDDFYQRDVAMEYEDLDYDVNEQFDDDDVDIGAEENEDMGGFTADIDDDDEEEDMDEEDEEEDVGSAILGQGIAPGKKLILSKNGDMGSVDGSISKASGKDGQKDTALSDSGSITERSDNDQSFSPPVKKMKLNANTDKEGQGQPIASTVQLDENGDRILTFEAVRKEIWLHAGRILLMQLAKIYNINKKTSVERRSKFLAITKDLCNPEDSIDGKMLVLKQHYAKLG